MERRYVLVSYDPQTAQSIRYRIVISANAPRTVQNLTEWTFFGL